MVGPTDEDLTDPQTPREIDATITPGAVLGGRYVVRQRLGGGGMGSVWRVHDERTGEDMALKVLPPQAGDDALTRFRREVTLARRIAHLNVCRVFDLGDADGLHFLTMELIEGENLRARLARGQPAWEDACRLIADLLAGLAAVHGAGIVHRDIKPENILIAADGRAVIVDFGLAWMPTTEVATAPELGTPQYMAPEQLSGGTIDRRSDVFAAGVVIHEILDGRPPFHGATAALVSSAILRDSPSPLEGKDLPAAVRNAVARVVSRALSRDARMRHADAGELRKDWLAAVADARASRTPVRRHAVLGCAVVLALIVATLTARSISHRGAPERSTTAALVAEHSTGEVPVVEHSRVFDAGLKPISFVITPPWAAGISHEIVQAYGTYQHMNVHSTSHSNDFHAMDFDLEPGEAVYPVADGTVVYAGPATGAWDGYGNIVFLNHVVDGVNYQSLYAHLSSIAITGGTVSTSTNLGQAGRTGSPGRVVLHLAIYRGASFTTTDANGIGPYGGEAVIAEPFAACSKNGGPCDRFITGDVLLRTASPAP